MKGEFVLTSDGWEIRFASGDFLPVDADLAYEASGYDQAVLDETRKLCGILRIRAKTNLEAAIILADLRTGLERARKIKAQRAHDRDMDFSSCRRPRPLRRRDATSAILYLSTRGDMMGTYSTQEYLDTFGGMPEPGETYQDDPDAARDAMEERTREEYKANDAAADAAIESFVVKTMR